MKKNPEIKKLVKSHGNYIVFVTPEAKELGWNENTLVVVKPIKTEAESKLEIKKVVVKT